jgi:prepilin-type N-terminal cleavage/methylation domain-containing protein
MRRPSAIFVRSGARARGFTLIEIMIVAALLTLFAGLAIFGVQQMYDSNKRKAMFDETRQIGVGLSFARDDIGFFPRLNMIEHSLTLILFNGPVIRPGFDTYGYMTESATQINNVINNWKGPYMQVSEARAGLAQGQKGLTQMRLPEGEPSTAPSELGDLSLVKWPTDIWGNPYVVYLISSDANVASADNPKGLRLIERPGELPSYMAAVVSYGENGLPGGNDNSYTGGTAGNYVRNVLSEAALFLPWDEANPGSIPGAGTDAFLELYTTHRASVYTLKSMQGSGQSDLTQLTNETLAQSIEALAPDSATGAVGILDKGSDDVFWRF